MADENLDTPEEPSGYGLVYPFVVCQSKGGPYDDDAFLAGVQYGMVAAELQVDQPERLARYLYSALHPQLDLLAMHEGYTLTAEPVADLPEWTWYVFTRSRT